MKQGYVYIMRLVKDLSLYEDIANVEGLPQRLRGRESICNARDKVLIPELGRSLGGENGNPS